ncbi:MAG: ribonuclease H-like domain-containing protein [bacterium]|nr:ribonuclease H-like domain-containing protein [bacterium]
MPKLVFDIETVGVDFEALDPTAQELLLASAKDDAERQVIREMLGVSPLTGRVVAVAFLNPETNKGGVYYQKQNDNEKEEEVDGYLMVPCADEKEILKRFWDLANHYDQFITFNGYGFDCPFMMIRSAIFKIKPSVNLMHNRYYDKPHLDVYDKLTNYGAVRFKRSLHLWCQAFGIESPKDKGITGHDVGQYFKDKRCREIALYCVGDIKSTAKLYEYWEKYMSSK